MTESECAVKRCDDEPTHKLTARDGAGELHTALVCKRHADHHREVDQLRRHPSPRATATSDPPDWWLVSIDELKEAANAR